MERYIPGTYILWAEYRCHHCGRLPPDFFAETGVVSPKYMALFNAHSRIRERYGRPVAVGRGYTCEDHQIYIFLHKVMEKYGSQLDPETIIQILNDSTMTPFSIHVFGIALDMSPLKKGLTPAQFQEELAKLRRIILKTEPDLRIGRSYSTHVHVDRGFDIDPKYSEKLRRGARW
jgi:hypothetical protein